GRGAERRRRGGRTAAGRPVSERRLRPDLPPADRPRVVVARPARPPGPARRGVAVLRGPRRRPPPVAANPRPRGGNGEGRPRRGLLGGLRPGGGRAARPPRSAAAGHPAPPGL